jgi:hypothetical protein
VGTLQTGCVQPSTHGDRRLLRVLLLARALALVVAWPALAPTDPDYWWHARTGELIAQTGRVPLADPYSFTAAGQRWVTHEWLSELLFYAVQHQFGYVGNVLLLGALGCLAVVALYATCRRWGVGELPAVVLVLWAFGMSLGSFGVRPQSITRVLLTLLALLLTVYRHTGRRAWLVLVPPLFFLWTNLHGGFAVGLGLLGLTVAGDIVDRVRARPWQALVSSSWPLLATVFASVVAALLTPNGVAGLLYPLAFVMQGTGGQQLISEWQPPDVRQLAFAPFTASLLLALALGWIRRPPLRTAEAFWVLAFSLLALQSIRNIQLYATVVTPLIGARLCTEVPAFSRGVRAWRTPRRMVVLWTAVTLVACVYMGYFAKSAGVSPQLGWWPSSAAFPEGGAAYLRDHNLGGNLFNQFEWGGYLINFNYPQQRVFIDGRPDMYGPALFDEYVDVVQLAPNWREILDKHAIELVLVDRESTLASALADDPQWDELYAGPVERLFQRGPSTVNYPRRRSVAKVGFGIAGAGYAPHNPRQPKLYSPPTRALHTSGAVI